VTQPLPTGYQLDPADPRAPSSEQWDAMTPAERVRVVDALPTSLPLEMNPPEGDAHRTAKTAALEALDDFFRRAGRRIYLSSELLVLYPGERGFVPDVLAVLDVEPRERMRWVVDTEGKGLDLVIEVHVAGNRVKDEEQNVERYARLQIREYFVFDRARMRLHGYRLSAGARAYQRLVPQAGRLASEVLGLDLVVLSGKLRFFLGNALVEESAERIAHLGGMLDEVIAHKEEAEEAIAAARLEVGELAGRLEEADRLLEEARAEIERLKRRD
jgi:Uma2 family endonuclease